MLTKIGYKLGQTDHLDVQWSSLFHGGLMELFPSETADFLHETGLHPYTQSLQRRGNDWYWVITALNHEMADVLEQSLAGRDCIEIKKKEQTILLLDRQVSTQNMEELARSFYEEEAPRYVTLRFLTPTAFKRQGQYCFYPDIRCIYQSLMNKYDAASASESMDDEDTLMYLCEHTQVVHYNLKSVRFHLEGIKVPAFIGQITVRLSGTQTMVNFANMLFRFGGYSGIGIKTALGMGAFQYSTSF